MRYIWYTIYNFFLLPIMVFIGIIGVIFNKKIREGFFGRFNTDGTLDDFISSLDGNNQTIYWFHASSHGEFLQTKPVLVGLKEIEPHIKIIVSFFSPSGYNNIDDNIIDCKIYLPFDFPWLVRKALKTIKPEKLIFAAYDIWPNLIWTAKAMNIPTVLFAAKFKRKTKKLMPLVRSFYQHVYNNFYSIYTITKKDDEKLRLILDKSKNMILRVLGNPRYDQVNKVSDQYSIEHTKEILNRKKSIILGSMHNEDKKNIIDCLMDLLNDNNDIYIIWVPHEPISRNINLVYDYFLDKGYSVELYSEQNKLGTDHPRIIIVDVVGVLSKIYWNGIIAYIGGGFSTGIHNVMEPAIARLPVIFGPHYDNFQEAIELIDLGGGWSINNSEEFYNISNKLINNEKFLLNASEAATDVIHNNIGAATRVVRGIIRD
ncbi:MAG: glycosyltransferase N-terminal domain-containing protein [Candidatus Neomarinimicrobiota bacterium]|nr:glycosyltransferase N-terminal domain-containing protein [Candidatus Neomarinimicrobiota bacterium]